MAFSNSVVSGTFTATGQSGNATSGTASGRVTDDNRSPVGGLSGTTNPPVFYQFFNIALWGTFSATIQLEKSFDGTTWLVCCEDNSGTAAAYTAPVNLTAYEPEQGVQYRWNCTAFTSGTINYRISQ